MKKRLAAIFLMFILVLVSVYGNADYDEKSSGLFTYKLKGNGNAVITGFNWKNNNGNDIYVPRLIDGYTVTEIGEYAFSSTEAGNTIVDKRHYMADDEEHYVGQSVAVVLPDTITMIGEKAFFCTKISTVTIPQNCQFIGKGAFAGCINLKNHSVASGNNTFAVIDGVLYNKANKELVSYPAGKDAEMNIPEGIVSIGDYAFYGIRLPMDKVSFQGYKTRLSISTTVKSIGEYAFAFAHLWSTDFSNVETIKDCAFYNTYLSDVSFPEIHSIGKSAFEYAELWDSFTLSSSLETIGESAFSKCWRDDYGFNLSETKITAIPDNAFYDIRYNTKVLKILLPSNLETIGANAFAKISQSRSGIQITIPASVKSIGDEAFMRSDIYQLVFEENSKLETIGTSSFKNAYFCYNEKIILPSETKSMGSESFFTKNVLILYIPKSVDFIGDGVCDRNVTQLEVEDGSYAAFYATENGFPAIISGAQEDTSWLND